MRHCLVAAGSNALRRAAMRPRGDGAFGGSNRTRTLREEDLRRRARARETIEYLTGLTHVRNAVECGPRAAWKLEVWIYTAALKLRATLQSGLDRARVLEVI